MSFAFCTTISAHKRQKPLALTVINVNDFAGRLTDRQSESQADWQPLSEELSKWLGAQVWSWGPGGMSHAPKRTHAHGAQKDAAWLAGRQEVGGVATS